MASSADVQAAVDDLAASLGHAVLIEDPRHKPLWWSAQGDVDGTRIRSILERTVAPAAAALVARMRLAELDGPVRTPAVPEADMLPRWCVPLRTGRDLLGYLWVLDADATVTDADLPLIVACGDFAAAALGRERATAADRDQRRSSLLDRLQASADDGAAGELIALEGLDPAVTVTVNAPRAAGGWELRGAMSAHVNAATHSVATHRAATHSAATHSVATSGPAVPLADLRVAVQRAEQTRRALRAGAQLSRPTWDALGSWHLIVAAPAGISVADIHQGADVLARLPRPDLMITARTVLDRGGDIATAAAVLHIHRTTLYYRLARIEALTGVNLRTGPGRDDLHMALRLAAYRLADA